MNLRLIIIISTVIIVSVLQIRKVCTPDKFRIAKRRLQIAIIILGSIGLILTIIPKPSSRTFGILKPKDSSHALVEANTYTFDMVTHILTARLPDGATIQPFGNKVPFWLTITKGNLSISAVVYDLNGKVVAELRDNHWHHTLPDGYLWNSDVSGFEIVNQYRIPICQVDYLTLTSFRFGGILRSEKYETSILWPEYPRETVQLTGGGLEPPADGMILLGANVVGTVPCTQSDEEMRNTIAHVRTFMWPWFDYSDPSKHGVRLKQPTIDVRPGVDTPLFKGTIQKK